MSNRRHPLGTRILAQPPPLNPGIGLRREADLMARLPDAELAGYEGPGVVPPAQARRGARPEASAPLAPPTFRPLAGAAENNRGASRLVEVPAGAGQIVVGSIVETSRDSGNDAESLSVVCTALLPPVSSVDSVSVEGFVEFGVGGASFVAEFDWLAGVSFSLPASFARVGARLAHVTTNPQKVTLSAALAYGEGAQLHGSPLRKTLPLDVAAGATTAFEDIPAFASTVTLAVNGTAAPNLRLRLIGPQLRVLGPGVVVAVNQEAVYEVTSRTSGAWQQDAFPIPGWARAWTVQNLGAVSVEGGAVFGLAL